LKKKERFMYNSSERRILSWNVNGIRAVYKKNFMDWFLKEQPDILCIQETKAQEEQIPDGIDIATDLFEN